MDTELLRRWKVLRGLKDDELSNIAFVIIYGDHPEQNAIFIEKASDEVYGVGSEIISKTKLPIMMKSFPTSGQKVKIVQFSGLELERIVVGSTLVGGLAKSGRVHLWYSLLKKSNEDKAVIMYERYKPNKVCKKCSNASHGYGYSYSEHCYINRCVGGVDLNCCPNKSDLFCTYTAASPPPIGTPVAEFVRSDVAMMICLKCSLHCTSAMLGETSLEYCERCNIFPEYTKNAIVLKVVDKTLKEELLCKGVVDIACGAHFLSLLTNSNDLIVHGSIVNHFFKSPVVNPDRIIMKAISCGSNHIAAVSTCGELHTCGLGVQGQLGYPSKFVHLTLRRVKLEGVVVKVCCGYSATICLMLDGSIYCFGTNMKLDEHGGLIVNQLETDIIIKPTKIMEGQKFIDIANVPFTNKFFARSKSLVYSWGHRSSDFPLPEAILGASSLLEALINHPIAASYVESSPQNQRISSPLQMDFTSLYGKNHLSDLVKLSDGNFPVHSLVLFTKSVYFRENILQETATPPKELDMTSYNPVVYKVLLKYFYQLPPDDLDCSDLVDLYSLATSYKEADILVDAYDKLKEKLSISTVKLIHSKAKEAGCKDLLQQCEIFMRTPLFQAKLLHVLAQSTETTLSLL